MKFLAETEEDIKTLKEGIEEELKNPKLNFFVGEVMKATGGKANPELAKKLIFVKLNEDSCYINLRELLGLAKTKTGSSAVTFKNL